MDKKVVEGKHNVLVHYVDACAPNLFGAVLCNPFKWDILWFILIKNLVICVPTTLAEWILFCNHNMNKRNVGGKKNCSTTLCDCLCTWPIWWVRCNPFKWDILWFILIKNLLISVPTTLAKQILFLNHMNRKVVGDKHNALVHYMDASAPDPSGVVFCNPFKWDILCSFLIKNHIVIFVPSTKA